MTTQRTIGPVNDASYGHVLHCNKPVKKCFLTFKLTIFLKFKLKA
jgi:hypothetical protein